MTLISHNFSYFLTYQERNVMTTTDIVIAPVEKQIDNQSLSEKPIAQCYDIPNKSYQEINGIFLKIPF